MASGSAAYLVEVLVGIERCTLAAAARKRLQWLAARAIGGVQPAEGSAQDGTAAMDLLACVLAEAEEFAAEKPSVSSVKETLRRAGHADLASRTSRLSKVRNSRAHLDVGLPAAVRRALRQGGEGPQTESLEGGSTGLSSSEEISSTSVESEVLEGKRFTYK